MADKLPEFCRVQHMSEEKANAWYAGLMAWIDNNQKHIDLGAAIVFWRKAYFDVMWHRNYGPNAHLLVELDQYRELNQQQAGKIMELELTIRCLRRVHKSKYKET